MPISAHVDLGIALDMQKKFLEALHELQIGQRVHPIDAKIALQIARILARTGDAPATIQIYERLILSERAAQ